MAILKVNNVTKQFGKFTALDGVNLEINKGEVYGFIRTKSEQAKLLLFVYYLESYKQLKVMQLFLIKMFGRML